MKLSNNRNILTKHVIKNNNKFFNNHIQHRNCSDDESPICNQIMGACLIGMFAMFIAIFDGEMTMRRRK